MYVIQPIEKTCFSLYANKKDADQPAQHPRRLVSVFVVRSLDSILGIRNRN